MTDSYSRLLKSQHCEIEDNIKIKELLNKNDFQEKKQFENLLGLTEKPNEEIYLDITTKKDFSIIEKNLELTNKKITMVASPGFNMTIPKFQNDEEETEIRIGLNEQVLLVLSAQSEILNTYFSIINGKIQGLEGYETFMKSIDLGSYNNEVDDTLLKEFLSSADEIKSKYKLYSSILKENGKQP